MRLRPTDTPDAPPQYLRPSSMALVFAGGASGSVVRYAVAGWFPDAGHGWPVATSSVNIVGSAILGLLIALGIGSSTLQRSSGTDLERSSGTDLERSSGTDLERSSVAGPQRSGRRRLRAHLLLGVGFCGGLSTYSGVALDVVARWESSIGSALVVLVGEVVLSVFAAGLAFALTTVALRSPGRTAEQSEQAR